MPFVPKTYNRNLKEPKFYPYSTAVGSKSYNPKRIMYYNDAGDLLKIEEIWRGKKFIQTISGSAYTNHDVSYTITYGPWEESNI